MRQGRFSTYGEFLGEALDPSRFLTQEQIDWCDKHIDGKWGVNAKGEVTVPLYVSFKYKSFERFPVQFAPVKGDFDCRDCPNLASLKGAPSHVGGSFSCSECPKLTSLEGAPSHVGRYFSCGECPIVSLKGAPSHVGDSFNCRSCPKLASLEGAPAHVGGYFWYNDCPKLPASFEGIIEDFMEGRIDWKMAHKLIHSETGRKAHSIGLI